MSICSNFQLTYSRNNKVSSLSKKKSECDGNGCSSDISLQVGVSCDVIFTVGEKKRQIILSLRWWCGTSMILDQFLLLLQSYVKKSFNLFIPQCLICKTLPPLFWLSCLFIQRIPSGRVLLPVRVPSTKELLSHMGISQCY